MHKNMFNKLEGRWERAQTSAKGNSPLFCNMQMCKLQQIYMFKYALAAPVFIEPFCY